MRTYDRRELLARLDLEEAFLRQLERESIVHLDIGSDVEGRADAEAGRYSERMVERVRVAYSLVTELEVNLPGVAVILRMRETLAHTQGKLRRVESVLLERASSVSIDVGDGGDGGDTVD